MLSCEILFDLFKFYKLIRSSKIFEDSFLKNDIFNKGNIQNMISTEIVITNFREKRKLSLMISIYFELLGFLHSIF